MRMASLVEESQRLASTDVLTGLMTRRAFVSAMDIELARSERHCYPLTLAVLDVDRFKQVNDTHGHATGDVVLGALGKLLRRGILRKTDLAARWGGEEFVIAYLSTGRQGALTATERLRAAVAGLSLVDAHDRPLAVTISIGVTEVAPGEALDEVIARADAAMYASKRAGRNRVTLFDPSAREAPADAEPVSVRATSIN
jgi:diguanylate cyclase (GGDEF)-like protein